MKKKYRITEVARIFGISRQTLIYYDKIGLFKPEFIDEENSYRYYIEEQFFQLRFILILKRAGFSLEEIKNYTKTGSPEESLSYLEERERAVGEKIRALEASREIIQRKIREIKNITGGAKEEPELIELRKKRVFLVDLEEPFNFKDYDRAFLSLSHIRGKLGIGEDEYVEEVTRECIEEKDYMGIKTLGFFIPDSVGNIEGERVIEEGIYATLMHRDIWTKIGDSYEKLLVFLEEKGYRMAGDAVEVFNSVSVHLGKGEGTRVRIYIPLKKAE